MPRAFNTSLLAVVELCATHRLTAGDLANELIAFSTSKEHGALLTLDFLTIFEHEVRVRARGGWLAGFSSLKADSSTLFSNGEGSPGVPRPVRGPALQNGGEGADWKESRPG